MPGTLEYYLLKKIQKQVHCATGPLFAESLNLKKMTLKWSVLALYMYSFRVYSQSPSLKYGRTVLQRKFFNGGETIRANILGVILHGGVIVILCKESGSLINVFPSNLNTMNPNFFFKHGGIEFIV